MKFALLLHGFAATGLIASSALARIGDSFADCELRYGSLTPCAPDVAEFVFISQRPQPPSELKDTTYESFTKYRVSYMRNLSARTRGSIVRNEPTYRAKVGDYEVLLRFVDGVCHFVGYKKNPWILSDEEATELIVRNFGRSSLKDSHIAPDVKYFFSKDATLNRKLSSALATPLSSQTAEIQKMIQQCEEAESAAKAAGNTTEAQRWQSTLQTLKNKMADAEQSESQAMAAYDMAAGTLAIWSREMFNLMRTEEILSQKAASEKSPKDTGRSGFDQL